jgi:thymidylate synthase
MRTALTVLVCALFGFQNVHFFATLVEEVAAGVGLPVGPYTHFISSLCHDRSATQC